MTKRSGALHTPQIPKNSELRYKKSDAEIKSPPDVKRVLRMRPSPDSVLVDLNLSKDGGAGMLSESRDFSAPLNLTDILAGERSECTAHGLLPLVPDATTRRIVIETNLFVCHVDKYCSTFRSIHTRNIKKMVQRVLEDTFGRNSCEIVAFGSDACALALPDSDIDISFIVNHEEPVDPLELLLSVQETLVNKPHNAWVREVKCVPASNVPILRFIGVGNVHVDLSVRGRKHLGIPMRRWMMVQMKKHRGLLRPLLLVIKQMLRDRKLHESSVGGFNSTGIFLLVNCLLEELNLTPNAKLSIGKLLLLFLKVFGSLDYSTWAITAQGFVTRSSKKNVMASIDLSNGLVREQPMPRSRSDLNIHNDDGYSQVLIIDPCNKSNNVAKCAYRLTPVRKIAFLG